MTAVAEATLHVYGFSSTELGSSDTGSPGHPQTKHSEENLYTVTVINDTDRTTNIAAYSPHMSRRGRRARSRPQGTASDHAPVSPDSKPSSNRTHTPS